MLGLLVSLANFVVPQHLKSAVWLYLKQQHRERKSESILKRLANERRLKEAGRFQWQPECCYRDCRSPVCPGVRMCPGHHLTEKDREAQMGRFQFKTSLLERSNEITQWYSELDVAFFLRRSLDEVRLNEQGRLRPMATLPSRKKVDTKPPGRNAPQAVRITGASVEVGYSA